MFSVFVPSESSLKKHPATDPVALPDNAVWIDLVKPTMEEDRAVERLAGIAVPTREDMQEIEISSRLYIENGARYMTATLMCQSDTDAPKTTAVTFILAGHRLVTVRYDEPKPFALVEHKLARSCMPAISGERVLMELLDAVIDLPFALPTIVAGLTLLALYGPKGPLGVNVASDFEPLYVVDGWVNMPRQISSASVNSS